jgi:endothelin-converting enzyme/putative endopeptidase
MTLSVIRFLQNTTCTTALLLAAVSLDVRSMDRSADPCEDLYTFACGGWQKNNPIPADQSSWSVYGKLYEDNQHYLWGVHE